MRVQILHCAAAEFKDVKPSKKPPGIKPRPTSDILIEPTSKQLKDPKLAKLISQFEDIDLNNTHESPIKIKRDYLQMVLGVDSHELKQLFQKAHQQGLMRKLTINKDYGAWLHHSSKKGLLVLMICIEKGDYERKDLPKRFCDELMAHRNKLISKGHELNDIILVPNAHLTSYKELELDSEHTKTVLKRISKYVKNRGLNFKEASFGFGKSVKLIIRGHEKSYTFRLL